MVIAKTRLENKIFSNGNDGRFQSVSPDVKWTGSDAVRAAGKDRTGRNARFFQSDRPAVAGRFSFDQLVSSLCPQGVNSAN